MTRVNTFEDAAEAAAAVAEFRDGCVEAEECGSLVLVDKAPDGLWAVKLNDDRADVFLEAHGQGGGVDVRTRWNAYLGDKVEVRLDVELTGRDECLMILFQSRQLPFLLRANLAKQIALWSVRTGHLISMDLTPDATPLTAAALMLAKQMRHTAAGDDGTDG